MIRGLLCLYCNTAIGKLNTPELLRRAATYLEQAHTGEYVTPSPKHPCPHCGTEMHWEGISRYPLQGTKARYRCHQCGNLTLKNTIAPSALRVKVHLVEPAPVVHST